MRDRLMNSSTSWPRSRMTLPKRYAGNSPWSMNRYSVRGVMPNRRAASWVESQSVSSVFTPDTLPPRVVFEHLSVNSWSRSRDHVRCVRHHLVLGGGGGSERPLSTQRADHRGPVGEGLRDMFRLHEVAKTDGDDASERRRTRDPGAGGTPASRRAAHPGG